MKYLKVFGEYILNEEFSKNDPIPELNSSEKLGIILLGPPAVGKCLEYNTLILLNNKLVKIGEIIESSIESSIEGEITIPISNYFVNSVDDNGYIIENKVSHFYRGYSDTLLRFRSQTGIDIKVTPKHPLLVNTISGDIVWKESKDILLSDKISRPRTILNSNYIITPKISKELARIIGYGLSDGDFSYKKNSMYFNLTSIDDDIILDFKKCIEKESDNILTIKSRKLKHSVQFNDNVKKGHRNLHKDKFNFIKNIGDICGEYIFSKKSYFVKIPEVIFEDLELLKNFIGCYFACDGSNFRNRVEFYSTSKEIITDITYALLKFGINSSVRNKKTKLNGKVFNSFIIRITNEDYNRFGLVFNDYIPCNRKLIKIIDNINPNIGSFIPSDELINIIKSNKLIKKIKKNIGYSFSKNLKYRRPLTKIRLNKIVSYLKENNISDEYINKYENIHNNLFFDKIEKIEKIEHNGYVYDVVLSDFHNFIGGNIPTILHNSTFASNYITHKNRDIKIFSTDDVSLTRTKNPTQYKNGSSELNIKRLKMFIKTGGSFIYDTTGTQKENISSITKLAHSEGYQVIFIHLIGTLDMSLKQNIQRDRNVPTDFIKLAYDKQFKNMKFFSELRPESYYIVYNIDGKYKFMKYEDGKLLKRKVDKYVSLKESVETKDDDFDIEDVMLGKW